jgi:hypothetical protein
VKREPSFFADPEGTVFDCVVDVCGGLALAHEPQRNDRPGEAQQRSEGKYR